MSAENRPYPFIPDEELKAAAQDLGKMYPFEQKQTDGTTVSTRVSEWKKNARRFEREKDNGYLYPAARIESLDSKQPRLEAYHRESFIDWIKNHLAVAPEEKVSVLDIGGGAGLYAEQLRDIFQDKITVYTTGLRKEAAYKLREQIQAGKKFYTFPPDKPVKAEPHPDDLKWRSILQLSDFEEFNVIVDTIGEFSYSAETPEDMERYLLAVIHKLKVGGHASVVVATASQLKMLGPILEKISGHEKYQEIFSYKLLPTNFRTEFPDDGEQFVLKIDKLNSLKRSA